MRIHKRLPIVRPSREDAGLLELLGRQRRPVLVVVHCNHAQELGATVSDRLRVTQPAARALHQGIHARQAGDLAPRLVREIPGAPGKTAVDSPAQKTT